MSYVNLKSIQAKALASKKVEKSSEEIAEKKLEKAKEIFLSNFDEHPVTLEIQQGENASNTSGLLGGRGNLFSFIGFERGSSPIESLRKILEKNFKIKKKLGSSKQKRYVISYPSLDKIKLETPMPWQSGKSWVQGIEKGISGLSFYLYKKFNNSRSGTGLQSKSQVRSLAFKTTKYLSKIIDDFKKNIKI